MDILVPCIASLFLFSAGISWIVATWRSESRLSRIWYGRKWSESFVPEQKSATRLRASGVAGFYVLSGVGFLLMALNAVNPSIRQTIYPIQWALLILGAVWYGAAFILSSRRPQA